LVSGWALVTDDPGSSLDEALPPGYRALVIGASGTLGQAFHDHLLKDPRCGSVTPISRTVTPGFDLESPEGFNELVADLSPQGPFDLVIDATGVLVIGVRGPEKSLKALDPDQLARYFSINATGPLLLLKALEPHLSKDAPCYAKLSARVGSISDNRLGGWYGYRASKAALNMLLQTAAIELQRTRPRMRVLALQPGTVRSPLSAPFTRQGHEGMEAEISVAGLMEVIRNLPEGRGAAFVDYQGLPIDW
jgi:NAD(P)-dependent dehydrogenase (short-subunit alcohol dehydrogenase family)